MTAAKKLTPYRAPAFHLSIQTTAHDSGPSIPNRVQILRIGEFNDPRYGTFEITGKHLLAMKKNFDDKIRGVDIAIDYAHQSDQVAAGWIQGLELGFEDSDKGKVNPTTLWANPVKWTKKAELCLADGEFRYLSADFTFEYQDNETEKKYGPVLLGAGLTNRPVIKEMNPIIELQEGKGETMSVDLEKKCKELEEKLAELGAAMDKLKPPKDKEDQEEDHDDDEGEDDDELPPAAKKKMSQMKKKLAAYEAGEKEASEQKELSEKKSKFDKLLSEGKVVEAQRAPFMGNDAMKFAELAQPIKLASAGHGGDGGNDGGNSDSKTPAQDEVISLAEKMVVEKKIELSEAISKVLLANKSLNERYTKETTL